MKRFNLLFVIVFILLVCFFSQTWAWGSENGKGAAGPASLLFNFINLAILIYLIYHFGANPIKEFFKKRRESIAQPIEEAQKIKADAKSKHREYSERLSSINERIDKLFADMREEGERGKKIVIEGAAQFSEKIKEQAKLAAEQEAKKVMEKVKSDVADLITKAAEETLKKDMTEKDQERLIKGFLERLELN